MYVCIYFLLFNVNQYYSCIALPTVTSQNPFSHGELKKFLLELLFAVVALFIYFLCLSDFDITCTYYSMVQDVDFIHMKECTKHHGMQFWILRFMSFYVTFFSLSK